MHDTVSRILTEGPQGLAALAAAIPSHRRDSHLTPQALWRWAVRGIRLADGRVVRLETVRVAGRYLSSRAAVERFVRAQSEPTDPTPLPAASRSPARRQRASDRAAEQLDAAGI